MTQSIPSAIVLSLTMTVVSSGAVEQLTPHIVIERGPVNAVSIQADGKSLAVYGAVTGTHPDTVLFTHHRRDGGTLWTARIFNILP